MIETILIITLLTASPEGEIWEYRMINYDCKTEYAFSEGNVYLVKDGIPFLYPRIPFTTFAAYGEGWAAMYYRDGFAWGFLFSDFDNYRARQIGMCAFLVYRLDYVLKRKEVSICASFYLQ